jgi:hypothetical protein
MTPEGLVLENLPSCSSRDTAGFNDKAHLDDGAMWPVAYALKELTAADEARIAALVRKAAD